MAALRATSMAQISCVRPARLMAARPVQAPLIGGRGLVSPLLVRPQWMAAPLARRSLECRAAEESKQLDPLETAAAKLFGEKSAPAAVTLGFITLWYGLNVGFNLLNKSIFQYFPFPYTVSTVHVVVGTAYCALTYFMGLKSLSFGRAINKEEFGKVFGPAAMHAIGHIAANISFAAVAISLTHTVKTLEPAFNVLLSRLVLGEATPLPVVATLLPIMFGVALASAGELSFNWTGFISAMLSNLTFGFRAVWGKAAMTKTLDSTAVYAYTTLISMLICVPIALTMEGSALAAGAQAAIAKVGEARFYGDLFMVGLLYHLYNQFAFNTLQRVSPVSHGVCNVVKRVVIIFSSVLFFNQVLTSQALVGTVIALAGTWAYTEMSSKYKTKKAPPATGGDSKPATA
ncbi:triose phosphate phosphate translocator [Raphidocelis subcapitata]|uniref:Triose phosphate phosphate translocator n=1 Tax=Raphidocelis subcapitata TaxID=307507 RepID=A0A2V0P7D4_9CHLO|nr:triose phosphate phosphate translocator [Raphidocelis subcapitata]|eukprot:GBF93760.1 triose phosphate phosphate translocator [Raphidocelis subcapitata]